jgi:hypothetical protein
MISAHLKLRPPVCPKPNHLRLPRSKAVTIAAGFRFNGGVILCADTQETIEALHSKAWTPKLIVEPTTKIGNDSPDDLMIAIAGAGDGPFIDKLTELAWQSSRSAVSLSEACEKIQQSVKDTHEEYGRIFQPGLLPFTQLVYGVKMLGESKLFRSNGPIVNELRDYGAVGVGRYMADFLASRLSQRYLPSTQAFILAAYVLFQCKEHVDGCGGDSHIAILNETGGSAMLHPWRVESITELIRESEVHLPSLLLSALDYSIPPADFKTHLEFVMRGILALHQRSVDFKTQWERQLAEGKRLMYRAPLEAR